MVSEKFSCLGGNIDAKYFAENNEKIKTCIKKTKVGLSDWRDISVSACKNSTTARGCQTRRKIYAVYGAQQERDVLTVVEDICAKEILHIKEFKDYRSRTSREYSDGACYEMGYKYKGQKEKIKRAKDSSLDRCNVDQTARARALR